MSKFEWDENKNASNQQKHEISFEDASKVFNDPHRIQHINSTGNEKRFRTVGKVIKFIITVVYTVRTGVLRIISARQASVSERNAYLENKLKKTKDEP